MEQEWTNEFREQLQEVKARLTWVVAEVRDRTEGILAECGALVERLINANGLERDPSSGGSTSGDGSGFIREIGVMVTL